MDLTEQGVLHGSHAGVLWQVGSFGGIVDEVQALKRDKNVLMLELVRLRQQQQVKPCCLWVKCECSLRKDAGRQHVCQE